MSDPSGQKTCNICLFNGTQLSTAISAAPKHEMPDTGRHLTSFCFGGAWAPRGPPAALILSAQEGSSGAQPYTKIGSQTEPPVLPQHHGHTKSNHIKYFSTYCAIDSHAFKPIRQQHLLLTPRQVRCMLQRGHPRRCHRHKLRPLAWMCWRLEYQPRRGPDGPMCSTLAASHDNPEKMPVDLRLSAHTTHCFLRTSAASSVSQP